jgi:hypothetical protein
MGWGDKKQAKYEADQKKTAARTRKAHQDRLAREAAARAERDAKAAAKKAAQSARAARREGGAGKPTKIKGGWGY